MTVPRWIPENSSSKREKMLLRRVGGTKKLLAFLREQRFELFDAAFQDELALIYRDTGEGKAPVARALLAMVVLLQAYTGASDAEAVELTLVDARWQAVLGVLGSDVPGFPQAALCAFRQRMVAHDMDRRLLDRAYGRAGEAYKKDGSPLREDAAAASADHDSNGFSYCHRARHRCREAAWFNSSYANLRISARSTCSSVMTTAATGRRASTPFFADLTPARWAAARAVR